MLDLSRRTSKHGTEQPSLIGVNQLEEKADLIETSGRYRRGK